MRFQKSSIASRAIVCAVLFVVLTNSCSGDRDDVVKQTRFLMDTYVTIQAPDGTGVRDAIEKALDRMEAVDKKFNVLDPGNALYRFNQEGAEISDEEILRLLEQALSIGRETEGAFDITVFPLIRLWGFYGDSPALPEEGEIRERLRHVGSGNLGFENGRFVSHDPETKIDLGGIAKGYAIQGALEVLKSEGMPSALIDAGGDIYALGALHGNPWKVGIRNPRGEGVIGGVEISDLAVVTSGDYERFFEEDGVKYHHLLDPKTGYPARGLTSVTVISSDPVKADAWATAVFVLGKEKGMELVESTPDLEALIITDEGEMIGSSGTK